MVKFNPEPPPPTPPRPLGARHTLGSSPESHEPAESAPHPAVPSAPVHSAEAEPQMTIYLAPWYAAVERARGADPQVRPVLTALLEHVERAWVLVRPLECWFEERGERAKQKGTDEYWHLINFVNGDLVDIFRVVAAGVAALVPGYPEWHRDADPGDVDGDMDMFQRYLIVAGMAAADPGVPDELRALLRAASLELAHWATEFGVLIAVVNREVIVPGQNRR